MKRGFNVGSVMLLCGLSLGLGGCGENFGTQVFPAKSILSAQSIQTGTRTAVWSGISSCHNLQETYEPDQRQGSKGKVVNWSVCEVSVKVTCVGQRSDFDISKPGFEQSSGSNINEVLWTPKSCTIQLSGELVASDPTFSAISFSFSRVYPVNSTPNRFEFAIEGSNKNIFGNLWTPTIWENTPKVELGLGFEGVAPTRNPVSVPLARN